MAEETKDKTKSIPCPFEDKLKPQANNTPTEGALPVDERKEGKDFNKTAEDLVSQKDEMKEGDTIIKFSPDETPSGMAIREKSAGMVVEGGFEGFSIDYGKGMTVQGSFTINNMGEGISKAWFTENPLSFIPSTLYTEIPGYLFKAPNIDLFEGDFMSLFTDFLTNFYKG